MRTVACQGVLLLYCFLTVLLVPADTEFVVSFLVSVICVSVVRLGMLREKCIAVMFLFLLFSCFFPKLLFFAPVMLYSILEWRRYILGVVLFSLCVLFYLKTQTGVFMLLFVGCIFSCILIWQNEKYEALDVMFRQTRDDGKELNILLEERNKSLLKKQDDEIYTAKLKERNRIAREIHDHVGHMLSRAILMTGAIKAVNQNEGMEETLSQLEDTLNTAMTNVRESVHDLHDDSVNLKTVLSELAKEYTFCEAELIYDMGYVLPKEVKYGFIAIVKEALNNISKHSDATKVKVVAREHPGLYQLIIEDNGSGKKENSGSTDGMGIRNMKDRVSNLGGNMQIRREQGFRIYITVPKGEEAV